MLNASDNFIMPSITPVKQINTEARVSYLLAIGVIHADMLLCQTIGHFKYGSLVEAKQLLALLTALSTNIFTILQALTDEYSSTLATLLHPVGNQFCLNMHSQNKYFIRTSKNDTTFVIHIKLQHEFI